MKKRTLSKLKSLFSSKKDKRHHQQQLSSKSSRSPSPEPAAGELSPASNESFRPLLRTPPPSRAGPPPSPPVPTHPIAPVPPEPAGPLPLDPCPVCGRTFVPQSLAKHVKICEKMTVKKRKTFDSSRQRREGTDLAQFLPKNFGLPENSPFLEKSPPNTAKVTPKPKTQSVRNAITKPTAELQRCPHCSRAFGPRAFERHVEWCADKARLLPAAPARPPPHVADAKQRLNARTQYRAPAPPVRGRRSSQSRDKSSNSRSASVDSSRGVSPPPPREYGDYTKQPRTRASESASSNDCHEESPHVPVIRNSRQSQNNMSGDANVKARQARLARDLSSTRKPQESQPSSIHPSNTDPNIKKTTSQNKSKNKMTAKKQQQLKKLEEIAEKYNERNKRDKDEKSSVIKKPSEKSQIPVAQKTKIRNNHATLNVDKDNDVSNENNNPANDTKEDDCSKKIKCIRSKNSASSVASKAKAIENKANKEKKKGPSKKDSRNITLGKELSMSLDSLEENQSVSGREKNCQSIGINTELICPCVPCVIYENQDSKAFKKSKTNTKDKKRTKHADEPKVELLYKNLTMVSSCDIQALCEPQVESTLNENLLNFSSNETSNSEMINSVEIESSDVTMQNDHKMDVNITIEIPNSDVNIIEDTITEDIHNLSNEHYEDNYEHDISEEMDNDTNKSDNNNDNIENDILCRHGSGDTYTKFTENPADLDEFMSLTDKIMSDEKSQFEKDAEAQFEKDVENLHTPTTNSLEVIHGSESDKQPSSDTFKQAYAFSDTLENLKTDLNKLLNSAGDLETSQKFDEESNNNESRKICDMEHITVYQLKFYEKQPLEKTPDADVPPKLVLPAINVTNKPERKVTCNKKRMQRLFKTNKKYKMLGEQSRADTFIVKEKAEDDSDSHSITSEAPPLKLPRIEKKRLDDNYDPFVSAARQMKELMSSDTNIPKKLQNSSKDPNRTLPILRTGKEKTLPSYLRADNTKMMKDTLNKTYQKTPTLQRMKSFGSTNNDNSNSNTSFGSRCSSFRVSRNDKKSSQKLNTTFTKSSKENISTVEKTYFTRNSNLNRSFSSYNPSINSTPKPKDKIPKIATSMYHSFQRNTIKQPVKLDKIKRDDDKKEFVNLDSILADDNSSMTDSNYIDPRLINENDNLPINVNTILNNPDIISSMESLLTTENLPAKFDSFSTNQNNNNNNNKSDNKPEETRISCKNIESKNNNINKNTLNKKAAPIIDDLSTQYNRIMSSLEHSIASKTSNRDDESFCEDFDLEEFMLSFDDEINKQTVENKRTCSSTTRVVKQSEFADSNRSSEINSICSTPKLVNSNCLIPINKSMSLNFSSNNIVSENLFPSSVKRSNSLLESIQKKQGQKMDTTKGRHKTDQLEHDLMQSLKDFDKFYESERTDNAQPREISAYNMQVHNGTAKRESRVINERRNKKNEMATNGNRTPNGKSSNDSAYSSLNRISPSKLSICNSKEPNGLASLEQIPAGSDSSGKDEIRSVSSEEFLAMERSTELEEPQPQPDITSKELENHSVNEKRERADSRSSPRHSSSWRRSGRMSSSGSEASLPRARLSRFCHECGSKFPVDTAKFCIECGVRRLLV